MWRFMGYFTIKQKWKKKPISAVYIPPPISKMVLDDFLNNFNHLSETYKVSSFIVGDFNLSCAD